jgi:2-C-methyl-D-erythritol 4-phosphate cytidylyltransferase
VSVDRYFAVVPAAGRGSRMQADRPKQYLDCGGKPVLELTLSRLLAWPQLELVAVALASDDNYFDSLSISAEPRLLRCQGGEQRADSVLAGLRALADVASPRDWVLVHDAARPCIRLAELDKLARELRDEEVGGLLALPISETVKQADESDHVDQTLDRARLWLAQTPQMFRYGALAEALHAVSEKGLNLTDEAAAIERAGLQPRLVTGSISNIKITHPQDLALAQYWLANEERT